MHRPLFYSMIAIITNEHSKISTTAITCKLTRLSRMLRCEGPFWPTHTTPLYERFRQRGSTLARLPTPSDDIVVQVRRLRSVGSRVILLPVIRGCLAVLMCAASALFRCGVPTDHRE